MLSEIVPDVLARVSTCGSPGDLVPPVVLGCVVAVPAGDAGPGTVMQTGPGDATEAAQHADKAQRSAANCRRRARQHFQLQ